MNYETLAAYALGAIAKGWAPSREDLELFVASDVSDPRDAIQIGAIHAIEKAFKWVHEKNLAKLGYVRVPGATGTKPAKGGGNLVLARKGSELRDKAERLGLNKKSDAKSEHGKPIENLAPKKTEDPPAATAPKPDGEAKEPWEMTRGDVAIGSHESLGIDWVLGRMKAATGQKKESLKKEYANLQSVKQKAVDDHRAAVESAFASGKPVPAEVLADYPDLVEKYGKKADDKAKPREMTPEEKEIADTVAEHKSRDMARSTPRKGESARQELEDATAAAWSEYESHDDAIAEARRFRDSRKSQYSDAYKKADKKYKELQQKQSDAFDKHKALHNKLSVAILEDHAESGHPIKSELAKLHLALQNSKNPGMHDGVEKKIHQQVTEHLKKIAPAIAFNTEGHGMLPSDADEAAVNYAVSQVANRIIDGGPSQFDKAESLLSGYIRGERINAYRGIANKKINALENPNGSNRTHEKYNFEDIDKHVSDHVEHDKRVKAQRKAEAAAEKEAKAKFVNDFDAPNAHTEKPHTIGQIGKLLSNASNRIDFYNTARETGWASDGRFMLKLSDKEIAKIPESPHIDGRRLGQSMIDNVTQYTSGDVSVTGSRPSPVGIYDEPSKTSQVRFGKGKDAVVADAKLHATIMSRYPDAEIRFGKTPGTVVYVSGGQPVGVLMGFAAP